MRTTKQSMGEIIDRLTILMIKFSKIRSAKGRMTALRELIETIKGSGFEVDELDLGGKTGQLLDRSITGLYDINDHLWDVEVAIRKEPSIELIKEVHQWNADRSVFKSDINKCLGTDEEVKDYQC